MEDLSEDWYCKFASESQDVYVNVNDLQQAHTSHLLLQTLSMHDSHITPLLPELSEWWENI